MLSFLNRKLHARIGPVDPDRAEDCARLHAPAFAHPWSELDFERLLASDTSVADGAFDRPGRRLLGFVLSRHAAGEAEILTLVVDAGARRRGVGQSLLLAHIARLGVLDVGALFLEVEEGNHAARILYGAAGFLEVGKRQGYYRTKSGEHATALVLRRDIV